MKKPAIAFVLALTVISAACGDDDDSSGTPPPDSGTADTATPDTGAADTSVPDTSTPDTGADTSTAPTTVTVNVTSNVFTPALVTVKVGDTVKWVWGGGSHNVVSGANCLPDGTPPKFTSGALTSDTTFTYSHVFDTAGSFDYFCDAHCTVGMTGKVVVQ